MQYPETLFLTSFEKLQEKRVLLRIDLNTPFVGGLPVDTYRIDAAIETLKSLAIAGAKVIALSHFGEKGESLEASATYVSTRLPHVRFIKSVDRATVEKELIGMNPGEIVLLENVRLIPGEIEGSRELAQWFATLGDVYINDAFPVAHRTHASVVGIPEYTLSYLGPTFRRELEGLSYALIPKQPCLMILGGAKLTTKLPLIETYLKKGCYVYVGGAMVHNILKARGLSIGMSLYDPDFTPSDYVLTHEKLLTPRDVICDDGKEYEVTAVPADRKIVDCGGETLVSLTESINHASTIILNGPVGLYEDGYVKGTETLLATMGSLRSALTIVGGGDTLTVMHGLTPVPRMSFVSLGGGAMLDYLRDGTLPGIEAVVKSRQETMD